MDPINPTVLNSRLYSENNEEELNIAFYLKEEDT